MTDFTDAYRDLLIKQYWDKPRARAEIELQVGTWESVRDILQQFGDAFDVDLAEDVQLDILGKIVGVRRIVPLVVPKVAFGFADENPDARRFDDKFDPIVISAPFQDRFAPTRTPLELDDNALRLFIKATAARNASSAFMVSDTRISIQDVINAIFDGLAYVVDKQDMLLILYISPVYELDYVTAIKNLGLLPKPQGVRYDLIIQAAPGETFGFSDNPNALGFADKFDPAQEGGRFALKVI